MRLDTKVVGSILTCEVVLTFAAGGKTHGPAGTHRGPVVACEEGPRPAAGAPVSGEPLPPGCAAAR